MAATIPVLPEDIYPDFDPARGERAVEGYLSQSFALAFDAYDTVKAGISTLNGLDIVPVSFDEAVFDFTRPDLPTLPSFPSAPSYAPLTPPALLDAVDLSYVSGLESGITAFVDGATEDAAYARAMSALDATMLAEQQGVAEMYAASGWDSPSGPQALAVLAVGEKAAAGKRAAVRDIYVDSRVKALQIGLDAVKGKNDSVIAYNTAQTQAFAAQADALKAGFTAYESAVRGISVAYDAQARIWTAGVNVDLEKAKFSASYGLETIKAQIEQNERLTGIAFEAARAATAAASQAVAGGLSSGNFSLSHASGESISVSIGNGSSVSADLTPVEGS